MLAAGAEAPDQSESDSEGENRGRLRSNKEIIAVIDAAVVYSQRFGLGIACRQEGFGAERIDRVNTSYRGVSGAEALELEALAAILEGIDRVTVSCSK